MAPGVSSIYQARPIWAVWKNKSPDVLEGAKALMLSKHGLIADGCQPCL